MTATTKKPHEFTLFMEAVKTLSVDCDAPTLITLTTTGDAVTGHAQDLPGGAPTGDAMPAILLDMARRMRRDPQMFDASVIGFAVVLPGERWAFAADRSGWRTYGYQIPGVATERFNAVRESGIRDGIKAMIKALNATS